MIGTEAHWFYLIPKNTYVLALDQQRITNCIQSYGHLSRNANDWFCIPTERTVIFTHKDVVDADFQILNGRFRYTEGAPFRFSREDVSKCNSRINCMVFRLPHPVKWTGKHSGIPTNITESFVQIVVAAADILGHVYNANTQVPGWRQEMRKSLDAFVLASEQATESSL